MGRRGGATGVLFWIALSILAVCLFAKGRGKVHAPDGNRGGSKARAGCAITTSMNALVAQSELPHRASFGLLFLRSWTTAHHGSDQGPQGLLQRLQDLLDCSGKLSVLSVANRGPLFDEEGPQVFASDLSLGRPRQSLVAETGSSRTFESLHESVSATQSASPRKKQEGDAIRL